MKYVCFLAAAGFVSGAAAAEPPPALYTLDQSSAGEFLYLERCSSCHNADLTDGNHGPGLVTDTFWANWEKKPARELYGRIISTMPEDDPGTLSPSQALSLVAYILKANGYPAGDAPLASPNNLNGIALQRVK